MKRLGSVPTLTLAVVEICRSLLADDESPLDRGPHSSEFKEALASNLTACNKVVCDDAGSVQKLQAASWVCAVLTTALGDSSTMQYFTSPRAKDARAGLYLLLEMALQPVAELVDADDTPSLALPVLQCVANLLTNAQSSMRKEVVGMALQPLVALASSSQLRPYIQRHACRAIGALVRDSSEACAPCASALMSCVVRGSVADAAQETEVLTFRFQAILALSNVLVVNRDATWTADANFEPSLRAVQRELLLALKGVRVNAPKGHGSNIEGYDASLGQIGHACAQFVDSLVGNRRAWAAALGTQRAMPLVMLVIQLPISALPGQDGLPSAPAEFGFHALDELNTRAMNKGSVAWLEHVKTFVKGGGTSALVAALTSGHEEISGRAACFLSNLMTAIFRMQHEHNVPPPVRFADDKRLLSALILIAVDAHKMKSRNAALGALAGLCNQDSGSRNNVGKANATAYLLEMLVKLQPEHAFVPSPGPNPTEEVGTPEVVESVFRILHPLSYIPLEHARFLQVSGGLEAIASFMCASWLRRTAFDRRYMTVGYHMLAELACNEECRMRLMKSSMLIESAVKHLNDRVAWRGNPDAARFIGGSSPYEFEFYVMSFLFNCCSGEMETVAYDRADGASRALCCRLVLHVPLIKCLVGALNAPFVARTDPACGPLGTAIALLGALCSAAQSKWPSAKRLDAEDCHELYQVAETWQSCNAFKEIIRAANRLVKENQIVGPALHCAQLVLFAKHEAAIESAKEGGLDRLLEQHGGTPALGHLVSSVRMMSGTREMMASASDPAAFEAARVAMRDTAAEDMIDMMARMMPKMTDLVAGSDGNKDILWETLANKLPAHANPPGLLEHVRRRSQEIETATEQTKHRVLTPKPDDSMAQQKMVCATNMALAEPSQQGIANRKWMCFNVNCPSAETGTKFMKCPCGRVRYCSVECQRADWSVHKLSCSARKSK